MRRKDIWAQVELQLRNSRKDNPQWPDHLVAQASRVSIKCGDLVKTASYNKYGNKAVKDFKHTSVEDEAIGVIVEAIRFLENLALPP